MVLKIKLISIWKIRTLIHSFNSYKNYSIQIMYLNITPKTINLLEDNVGEMLSWIKY